MITTDSITTPTISNENLSLLQKYIPIIHWLPKYQWKTDLLQDFFAGIALLAVVIPQNMAYSSLAGLPPYYGLYTCLMPVLIYIIFGSGSFTAVGTFSLIAIMVKQGSDIIYQNIHNIPIENIAVDDTYMEIIFALTFWVGLLQFFMGILGVGKFITKYLLPTPAIKGFITASSLTIITTQLSPALGFSIPKLDLPFPVFFKWFYAVTHYQETNLFTFSLALGSILVILLVRQLNSKLEQRVGNNLELTPLLNLNNTTRRTKSINLPDILIIVILSTLIVKTLRLDIIGQVPIVGTIPKGLPNFQMLNLSYITNPAYIIHFLSPALTIAGTGYVITISASKAYQSEGYSKLSEDQELIAIGISSMIGSFFNAYANCGSLSRTAVMVRGNAKSQLAQLITTMLLSITMLYFTPLFYYLPKACLAAIVLIACQALLKDLLDFPQRLRNQFTMDGNNGGESLIDFAMWLAMTLSALALDLQRGLIWGIGIVVLLQLIPQRFLER
ncbi:hypothetical protein K502DRAFT_365370 [Neoconidiobolus thromboides FSU 785]|nr:hypothetical protein K502DRAFT_365370 [Neoconidiobolus thromboides FSU 785]